MVGYLVYMSAEEPTVGFVQSQLVVLKQYKHINCSVIKRLLEGIKYSVISILRLLDRGLFVLKVCILELNKNVYLSPIMLVERKCIDTEYILYIFNKT
jgi:hypothetical protein